jgi:uncharacterized membrane protein
MIIAIKATVTSRHAFIDVTRGAAMLFVLFSHFGFTYFPNQQDLLPQAMKLIGMVSTPTFIIISGTLVGFLYRTRGDGFGSIRVMLADRGIFLLTVGHLLILGSHIAFYTSRFVSITDTVGVCMIVGPWVVTRIRPRERLFLSLAVYSISWLVTLAWHPHGVALNATKETLFGSVETVSHAVYFGYAFPLLPWFSVDLAASVLGERLGALYLRGDRRSMERLLARIATIGLATAVALHAAFRGLGHLAPDNTLGFAAHILGSPLQKTPPAPVYLLFYGSLGLSLVLACHALERRAVMPALIHRAAAMGQTSFVVFVLQFFVYFTLLMPVRNHLPYAAWPAYFIGSVVVILLPAFAWHRRAYNRFLTIGLRRLCEGHALGRQRPRIVLDGSIAAAHP